MAAMPTPDRAPGQTAERTGRGASAGTARSAAQELARALGVGRVGLCFVYFGIGVWLLGAVLLPLVALPARRRGGSPDAVSRRVQRVAQLYFRSFITFMMSVMRVGRVEWVNAEGLARGPALVVANHPSLIDTPLLGTKLPQADFIVGAEWMRNGWMRRAIERVGYLSAEDGGALVQTAAERLRAGRTVVVYPEGSRTPREGLRRFQRGAAHMALEAGCDILPVVLHVTPRVLMKGQRLIDYPRERPVWRVEVGEPIHLPTPVAEEGRALAARRLTAVLEEYFQKRWERGSS